MSPTGAFPIRMSFKKKLTVLFFDTQFIFILEWRVDLDRAWEYSPSEEEFEAGRLGNFSNFWAQTLKASSFVQSIIDNGYIIPFDNPPPAFYAENNRSSLRNADFVEEAIKKLASFGCIEELSERPFCCNPLTVAEGEKPRLVLDLRHVNQYVSQNKFRYEDLRTLAQLFDEGDYFCTFDLRNGYHHIRINPHHTKYLGFE